MMEDKQLQGGQNGKRRDLPGEPEKSRKLQEAMQQIQAIYDSLLRDPGITASDLWAMEAKDARERDEDAGPQANSGKLCGKAPAESFGHSPVETPRQAAERLPVLSPKSGVTRIPREEVQQEAVRRLILRLF